MTVDPKKPISPLSESQGAADTIGVFRRHPDDRLEADKRRLLAELRNRGISDERVLDAMRRIPREVFVPPERRASAYVDSALPIECGQTISQPYIVALMTQELELAGDEHVLEIGTGSGYQCAILGLLARSVVSIERIPELAATARRRIEELGLENVEIVCADGTLGCPEKGPYDRILITAAAPRAPESLLAQLKDDGILLAPVGDRDLQRLERIRRRGDEFESETLIGCRFVPLIGQEGWSTDEV
ncbi:MAG: protein-L-isoaspartate(D-aspartate) O-methyltransferase [Planctomycetota bacterium]|nr:MAG: protein-L-isoaspartate(D-aspartate) O-methyltransferase [Planctomycetota bacterium]